MNLDPQLRKIIACPQCHGPLTDRDPLAGPPELICAACSLAFPITDGIPVLLLDDARSTG